MAATIPEIDIASLEDDDLADPDVLVLVVGEEEQVAAVEGGLHGP